MDGGWGRRLSGAGDTLGKPVPFDTKGTAETWAAGIESEMGRGIFVPRVEGEITTLESALGRYASEISNKKSGPREAYAIRVW